MTVRYTEHFLETAFRRMPLVRTHKWSVNINSGTGFVPSIYIKNMYWWVIAILIANNGYSIKGVPWVLPWFLWHHPIDIFFVFSYKDQKIVQKESTEQAPIPLRAFQSNSKFNKNLCCSLKYAQPIAKKFCTRHGSVVMCAKFHCDQKSTI